MKATRHMTVGSLLLVVALFITAAPAAANHTPPVSACSKTCAGEALFRPYDETLAIWDKALSDGKEVVVFNWRDNKYGKRFTGWTGAGQYSKGYDMSMPEDTKFEFRVCLGHVSARTYYPDTCGETKTAYA